MKKQMLIVTQALGYGIGGSEKALIEMLKALDTDRFDITVLSLMEAPEKPFASDKIKVVYGCAELVNSCKSLKTVLRSSRVTLREKIAKLRSSLYSRIHKGDFSKGLWQIYKNLIKAPETKYDIAIGYGVGLATYYVVDKVDSKMKIGWLNTSLADAHLDLDFCLHQYSQMDVVVADSKSGVDRFLNLYKGFKKPVYAIRNLLDFEELRQRGSEGKGFKDNYNGIRILSVGRLCEAKAFHFAIDAAKILNERGYNFRWYIVGFGSLEKELKQQIEDNGLEDTFFLLGSQSNPYPFFKECDIYVQTSIFEGSCITIEEAMAFYKPIVTTDFPAAFEKIIDNKNGLIAHMDAESIANAVERLLNDANLQSSFISYQKSNPLSYDEEMNKFYNIVDP